MTAPFTLAELNSVNHKLKTKKAPGKEDITNNMIKRLISIAKSKLLEIYSHSWHSNKFPERHQYSYLEKTSSYRPVSLLNCLGGKKT